MWGRRESVTRGGSRFWPGRLLPEVLKNADFRSYWFAIGLYELAVRGTIAATLWQTLELTDSTLYVGLVGLFEGVSLLLLSPLGGTLADRLDRRRLLQVAQGATLLGTLLLGLVTLAGVAQPWHVYLAVVMVSMTVSIDEPARQALVAALVPREQLVDAFALAYPTRTLGIFLGPAAAGVLITLGGTGVVYVGTAAIAALCIVLVGRLHVAPLEEASKVAVSLKSVLEGFVYVARHRLVWQLMSLDFSATFFAAYRVLLPALARDVLGVGPAGYGVLATAPALGALVGAGVTWQLRRHRRKGLLILLATMAYASCAVVLGLAPTFALAMLAGVGLGFFDAVTTTLRQAVIQIELPDQLRGRVTALYAMVAKGGPALGQAQMGAMATLLGPPIALSVGAAAPLAYAAALALRGRTLRNYRT